MSARSRRPLSVSIVCGSTKRAVPDLFVDGDPEGVQTRSRWIECVAQIMDDLAHARQQPGILQSRLAYGDAILTELSSFAEQPGRMRQCPHGNGSVIGRHTANIVAGQQEMVLGTQLRGPAVQRLRHRLAPRR